MFFLKKFITYWVLLPPGNLVLFLAFLALYLRFIKRKWVSRLTFAVAVLLYLLSIKPIAVSLIYPLEHQYKVPPPAVRDECDAVVVLGGGVKPGAPFLDLKNDLMEDTFKRTVGGLHLYLEKHRPIITSGYSSEDKKSEAQIMADFLNYFGIPRSFLITEDKSRDTYENALFTARIVKEKGFNKICLVTSAYHMPRAVMLFHRAGIENIIPVPVDFKSEDITPLTVYSFFPTSYWLDISAKALHEYFGLLFYLFNR